MTNVIELVQMKPITKPFRICVRLSREVGKLLKSEKKRVGRHVSLTHVVEKCIREQLLQKN